MAYRVVLADDEPKFRSWLRLLLDDSGDFLVVGEAGTGTEAVQLVASLLPDLVIADLCMPDGDGVEVARYVHEHSPSSKAILVSSHEDPVYQSLARERGALGFIPKALLSLEVLRHAVKGAG